MITQHEAMLSHVDKARMTISAITKLLAEPTSLDLYRARKWAKQLDRELAAAWRCSLDAVRERQQPDQQS